MDLLLNNVKGFGIHVLMSIVSVLLLAVSVGLSPFYGSQGLSIFVLICLYGLYIVIYLKLCCWLKLENNKKNDYLIGLLSIVVGIGIWAYAAYSTPLGYISEELAPQWRLYNIYTFPSWIVMYGQKNPFILLLGSLSPGVLLLMGIRIRRYKQSS